MAYKNGAPPAKLKKWRADDYKRHRSERLLKTGITTKARYKFWHEKAIEALGSKCVECGWTDIRALQIDHVNGDGAAERRVMTGWTIYKRVVEQAASGRYQLLCANHNYIKRYERKEDGTGIKKVG